MSRSSTETALDEHDTNDMSASIYGDAAIGVYRPPRIRRR